METKTRKTPVTDAVRDQGGDYLALVEALEERHATLLEALEGLFAAFQGNQSFSTAQWTAWERASRALALARSETTKEAPRG